MQELTNQGYPALLYAITNRQDETSFRIRWTPTQTFWKRIRSVLHGIAPSTLTAQLLTREKASIRNSKTLRSSTSQPVNYKEECFIYGRARTTKSDRSLLSISTFNSIQFNLFPAHINISYNIDNVHIMCRKRGGLKTVLMNVHPQTLTVVNY